MQVTFEEAMASREAAQIYLRNTKDVTAGEKAQIADKWGADFLTRALSADGNEYEIDDVSYDAAKQAGEDSAKKSTGYDGGKTGKSVVNAGLSVGAAVAGRVLGSQATAVLEFGTKELGEKSIGKNLSDVATAVLTSAVAAKYYLDKPNEEQLEAANKLMQEDFQEGQALLAETQDEMEETAQEVVELTEEAEEKTVEANEKIQTDKTNFDILKGQYEAAKAAKESGRKLTPDEEAILKNNAAQMQDLGECINATTEETSDDVNGINNTIGDFQDVYDESAESIANVDGVTSFAENFDENTRTMMYVETAAQGVNSVSAGVAAAKLWAKNAFSFGALTPFAVMASAAAIASGAAATQQYGWAGQMTEEIHARRDLQDFTEETNEIYEEKLDDYAGSIDVVEDLEIETPEDLTMPVPTSDTQSPAQSPAQTPAQGQAQAPANSPAANNGVQNSKGEENKDDDKKDDKKKDNVK